MCVLLPTANQSAFSVTGFFSWSDVHECSGGLQLALMAVGEKQPGCNLPHNCLMILCIDLSTFCGILSAVGSSGSVSCCVACYSVAPNHPQLTTPYRSLVVLVKNYLKWWAI